MSITKIQIKFALKDKEVKNVHDILRLSQLQEFHL